MASTTKPTKSRLAQSDLGISLHENRRTKSKQNARSPKQPGQAAGLLRALGRLANSAWDSIVPPECLWCEEQLGEPGTFCPACIRALVSQQYACIRCAAPLPDVIPNVDCIRCRKSRWRFDRVIALGPYRGILGDAVVRMKKPPQDLLRRGMALLMSQRLGTLDFEPNALLIPVPNHWLHRFLGKADSAGDLARQIAQERGLSVSTSNVQRIRKTAKQGMLAWSERANNVRGAFRISDAQALVGRHVILVDDVLTSGATMAELAKRIRQSGATRVSVLVAARGTGTREPKTPKA